MPGIWNANPILRKKTRDLLRTAQIFCIPNIFSSLIKTAA